MPGGNEAGMGTGSDDSSDFAVKEDGDGEIVSVD